MTPRKTKKSDARPAGPRRAPAGATPQGAVVIVVTEDPALASAVKAIVPAAAVVAGAEGAAAAAKTGARVALVDAALRDERAHEVLRRLRVSTRLRLALLHSDAKKMDSALLALAHFAGAEAVLPRVPKAAELRPFVAPPQPSVFDDDVLREKEQGAARSESFRDRLLHDLAHPHDPTLLHAISDPETRLLSSAFGSYAYDMDFKRAQRFGLPLSIALVGFEGEASTEVLLDLAAIFLNEIRDTDVLSRFDVNTFFFVMPNTLPEGARAMLERIAKSVQARKLRDLVRDPILLNSGVAGISTPSTDHRDELFVRARRAFEKARAESLAAVVA